MKKRAKITNKQKYMISGVLVALSVLMIAAALVWDNVAPPEISIEGGGRSGSAISVEAVSSIGRDRKEGVFSILVIGVDAASTSTDTIMLASFDTENKKMNIMSIPRDTITKTDRKNKKINGVYAASKQDIFALYDEVENVTGVRPDKYMFVSVDGFVELIDAIGGVEVDVPIDMKYEDPVQDLKIDINKGLQTLDGYDAMGFVRFRNTYADGDLGRIKVQHTFVEALIRKMLTPSTFAKIPELAQIFSDNIDTDLTLGNEIWLGRKILSMNLEEGVKMDTLPGYANYYEGLSYYFPDEEKVLELVNEYYNPYVNPIEELNLFN